MTKSKNPTPYILGMYFLFVAFVGESYLLWDMNSRISRNRQEISRLEEKTDYVISLIADIKAEFVGLKPEIKAYRNTLDAIMRSQHQSSTPRKYSPAPHEYCC